TGLGLGRGALDARGRERPRCAGLRARRLAVRAVRLARGERVPGPAAVGTAVAIRRPCGEGQGMTGERSDALVFFGITGDLAYKKIFPALHAMARRGALELPVVGVASSANSREALIERARESIETYRGGVDPTAFSALARTLRYVQGDYRTPATFSALREALGAAQRPLHYLAIPPSLFSTVIEGLSGAGCTRQARV